MASGPILTTAIQPPPGPNIKLTLPSNVKSFVDTPIFNDAIKVRMCVFVDEQRCSAAAGIDDGDTRSWQWVISASFHATSAPTPVGVIRFVPPPQPPHELLTHPNDPARKDLSQYDWTHQPCIKLTRVAVIPEYRGFGLGRRLVEMALEWAAQHAAEIDEAAVQLAEASSWDSTPIPWQGLVLVHAQVNAEKMYKALGFEMDESMGRWAEEGIEHVGMLRRVEVVR
ncbi:hypothetical protein VN97_g9906 [Penicillium thymicola]|uniref:Glucosamine 6-phosphate N-acetyltransferase n=1 Tax=Penicillium thymicola TaxID=293382 RepID=A0AAI9X4F6_PENTH|nr:hypothetical protein VN97_g9906 [Penicillium thymicola]